MLSSDKDIIPWIYNDCQNSYNCIVVRRFVIATLLLLLLPVSALAQNTSVQSEPASGSAIFPVPGGSNAFLGQKHDYSVVFRGNGEAVVSVRVALANSSDGELRDVELRIPDYITASELLAFQVIRDGSCIRYAQQGIGSPYIQPTCEEYAQPDYFQGYGQNKYQKASLELVGDTLKITLPTAIAKDRSGAFFVYMRASGLVKKDIFGSFNFNLETLKVNESIQALQVGISTDSDLILKGAKGQVDYRFEDASRNLAAAGTSEKAAASPAIDNFYNQIGYGTIIKTASGLAPLESYKVAGAYASTRLILYAKEIITGFAVFAVLGLIVSTVAKLLLRRAKTDTAKTAPSRTFLWTFLASAASAALIALYTVALLLISRVFENSYYYGVQNSQTFIWLIIAVISFVVYAFLIFAPSIFIGIKKGIVWGFATLGLTILWLVLLVFVVGLVIFLGAIDASPTPYLMEKGV